MDGAMAPLEGDSLPVGLEAQAVQHVCLVHVSGEAVQHPPLLNAVLLAQAMAQHLHDDAVRNCRDRGTSSHSVIPGTAPDPTGVQGSSSNLCLLGFLMPLTLD